MIGVKFSVTRTEKNGFYLVTVEQKMYVYA